jgi:hypothetical protein
MITTQNKDHSFSQPTTSTTLELSMLLIIRAGYQASYSFFQAFLEIGIMLFISLLNCLRPNFMLSLTSRAEVESHSQSTHFHFKRKMSPIRALLYQASSTSFLSKRKHKRKHTISTCMTKLELLFRFFSGLAEQTQLANP